MFNFSCEVIFFFFLRPDTDDSNQEIRVSEDSSESILQSSASHDSSKRSSDLTFSRLSLEPSSPIAAQENALDREITHDSNKYIKETTRNPNEEIRNNSRNRKKITRNEAEETTNPSETVKVCILVHVKSCLFLILIGKLLVDMLPEGSLRSSKMYSIQILPFLLLPCSLVSASGYLHAFYSQFKIFKQFTEIIFFLYFHMNQTFEVYAIIILNYYSSLCASHIHNRIGHGTTVLELVFMSRYESD